MLYDAFVYGALCYLLKAISRPCNSVFTYHCILAALTISSNIGIEVKEIIEHGFNAADSQRAMIGEFLSSFLCALFEELLLFEFFECLYPRFGHHVDRHFEEVPKLKHSFARPFFTEPCKSCH